MQITRRELLALSSVGVLASCGGSRSESASPDEPNAGSAPADPTSLTGTPQIARRFPTDVLVPGTVRMPVSLSTVVDGAAVVMQDGPGELIGRILDETGNPVTGELRALKRSNGLPSPHYTFDATIEEQGFYTLHIDGADPNGAAIQVVDPLTVRIPLVGAPLPGSDTPTDTDGRGVTPICTRTPGCGLHSITVREALALGKPVAYLIGTPAYCQTGVCGPILDLLLAEQDIRGASMTFVHAEVYSDETLKRTAAAVTDYNLMFEPVLFVTNAAGLLVARLDATMDADEIVSALNRATT